MQHENEFLNLVKEAKTRIKEVTISELKTLINDKKLPIIVDVREESEWDAGNIPNAMHLSKGIIERDIERVIPDKSAQIILYCGGGYRSALAADNIQKMGYSNVYSLDGGFRAWLDSQ